MQKWEYIAVRVTDLTDLALTEEYGENGWELVSVDIGIGYFKRPKVERWQDIQFMEGFLDDIQECLDVMRP